MSVSTFVTPWTCLFYYTSGLYVTLATSRSLFSHIPVAVVSSSFSSRVQKAGHFSHVLIDIEFLLQGMVGGKKRFRYQLSGSERYTEK